jgi:hypothetical protein
MTKTQEKQSTDGSLFSCRQHQNGHKKGKELYKMVPIDLDELSDANQPDGNIGQSAERPALPAVRYTDAELRQWVERHSDDRFFERFVRELYAADEIELLPEHLTIIKIGMEQIKDFSALPNSRNIGPGIGYTWSRQVRYETKYSHNFKAVDTGVYPPSKWLRPVFGNLSGESSSVSTRTIPFFFDNKI